MSIKILPYLYVRLKVAFQSALLQLFSLPQISGKNILRTFLHYFPCLYTTICTYSVPLPDIPNLLYILLYFDAFSVQRSTRTTGFHP